MPRIPVNGTELHVVDRGSGSPLLFVHGFPLDHTMWRGQIDHFAATEQAPGAKTPGVSNEADDDQPPDDDLDPSASQPPAEHRVFAPGRSPSFRVIAPDLRGFGQSAATDEPVTMATYADDLAALLDALDITEPVCLCGLSMGGYIAWAFIERHRERLGSLILCDTRAAADSEAAQKTREETAVRVLAEGPAFLADGMIDKLFTKATREQQPELITQTQEVIRNTSPIAIAAASRAMAARPDVTDRLGRIDLPTLLLVGQHDAISPPSEMREIFTALPRGTFVEIADAGHMAPLERPDTVNTAIEHFLASRT